VTQYMMGIAQNTAVGIKSDGTMGQTTGHLEVDTPQATVP